MPREGTGQKAQSSIRTKNFYLRKISMLIISGHVEGKSRELQILKKIFEARQHVTPLAKSHRGPVARRRTHKRRNSELGANAPAVTTESVLGTPCSPLFSLFLKFVSPFPSPEFSIRDCEVASIWFVALIIWQFDDSIALNQSHRDTESGIKRFDY